MKTAIIRNRCYAPDEWELEGNTYEFATFELTPEFLKDLKDAIASSISDHKLALDKYDQAGKPKFKPIFRGHTYHDPDRLSYFKRETLEKFIDLLEFDEAEADGDLGHIEIIGATLPEEIMEQRLRRTAGSYLEISGLGHFRWQNSLLHEDIIFSTDWFYHNDERFALDEENSPQGLDTQSQDFQLELSIEEAIRQAEEDEEATRKSKTTLEFTPSEQKMINELAEALGISIKTLLESAISYIYFYREDKSILHKIEAYSQKTEESPNRSIELRLSLEPEDKLQQLGMEGKIKECAIIGLGLLYEGLIKDKRQGASAE
jgi:hypothetical protein